MYLIEKIITLHFGRRGRVKISDQLAKEVWSAGDESRQFDIVAIVNKLC